MRGDAENDGRSGEAGAPPPARVVPSVDAAPVARAAPRTSGPRVVSVLATLSMSLLFAAAFGLWLMANLAHHREALAFAAERAAAPVARSIDPVEQLVVDVMHGGRAAADQQRELTLRPLDLQRVDVPPDFRLYRQLLEPLAAAVSFPQALADRLAHHGRPIALSAIAILQELDYRDGRDCRRAANLQRFLEQVTRVHGLRVETAGLEPSAREVCWFCAVADGWRQVGERYARDDAVFAQLRRSRGGLR